MTKSDQIRALHDQGYKVQEIADRLGIRYQFAYNVVSYYVANKQVAAGKQPKPQQEPSFSLWKWLIGKEA
jgi:transposase